MDPEIRADGFACLSESCADRYEGCLRTEVIPSSVSAKLGCFGIAVCVLIANICSLYRCEQTFAIQMFAFSAKLVYNSLRGQNHPATTNILTQTTTPRLIPKTTPSHHPKPTRNHHPKTTARPPSQSHHPEPPDTRTSSITPSQRTPSWQNRKPVKR